MAKQSRASLNWLDQHLPEGLIVDSGWLTRHGYSTSLRSQYVSAGWLSQPARRVYLRKHSPLSWQQVVISLQTLLRHNLIVGGRTALELQGYAHYLQHQASVVHLYGPDKPPSWLKTLQVSTRFEYHNDSRLFTRERATTAPHELSPRGGSSPKGESLKTMPWGQWNWPLVVSTPERAVLEMLDELPDHEAFHQVDVLIEGLSALSPTRMQKLLADCRSVKVKRLFFFFADRHQHAWLKRLDRKSLDLGSGRRMIVRGGRFDAKHLITVPKDFDGVR